MDTAHDNTDRQLKRLEKKISKEYTEATVQMQAKLEDYMRRFAVKDDIKRKMVDGGRLTEEEYAKWRYGQMCVGERWKEMVDTLAKDAANADQLAMSMVNGFTPDVYALNHNFGTYEAETKSGIDTSYTMYDRDTVEYLIKKNPDLLPRPRVDIPKDLQWNKKHIVSAITQGVLQGEAIPAIAKRLQQVTDMNRRAAIRNARTATTGAENAGRVDSYQRAKQMGIGMKQVWLATLDGRTRHSHRQLDGEKISVGDKWHPTKFSNGCRYPGDPQGKPSEVYNCRCTLIAEVEGDNIDTSDLRLRNTRHMNKNQTYEEWKNGHKRFGTDRVDKEPDTFEGKTQKIRERCQAKGKIEESDLMEAGKLVAKEQGQVFANTQNTLENLRKQEEEMWDKWDSGGWDIDKWSKISSERSKVAKRLRGEGAASTLKDTLSRIRPMGIDSADMNIKAHLNNSRSGIVKSITKAYDCYPTDWVRNSIDRGKLTPERSDRGYYNDWKKVIAISGRKEGNFHTAVHELGHRFERAVPGVLDAERVFYNRRTAGEGLQWLGPGYEPEEVTRFDKFLNPYMGKDYGGYAYELVSMGFQMAYTDPMGLAKDPDMEAWIYGILSLM